MNIEQRIVRVAGRRHGVITADQLRACGANRQWIARRANVGWLTSVGRGVYLVGSDTPDHRARWVAATDAGGPGSMLLGAAGLVQWGHLKEHRIPDTLSVHTPTRRRNRNRIEFVTRSWLADDRPRLISAVPLAPRWACIASVASEVHESELVRLIDDASFHERSTVRRLDDLVRGTPNLRGHHVLERALARLRTGDTGTASGFEEAVVRDLVELGAPPFLCNPRLVVPGGRPIKVDQYWADARLVLENDSGYHSQDHQRGRDLRRDQRLAAVGIDTARLPERLSGAARQALLRRVVSRAGQMKSGPEIPILHTSR